MTRDGGESAPRLRMAIQKDGRLTEQTVALLRGIGLDFDAYEQRLYSAVRNFGLDLLFTRDDDIPRYVASGTADLGVVGRNLIDEEGAEVTELMPLGFGHCALVLAVPKEGGASRLEDLAGRRIATKYPRTARRFLATRVIEQRVRERPEGSYVVKLLDEGTDRVARKIGEEAAEVIIAAKNRSGEELANEMVDLWFHSLLVLRDAGLTPDDVFRTLAARHGTARGTRR